MKPEVKQAVGKWTVPGITTTRPDDDALDRMARNLGTTREHIIAALRDEPLDKDAERV